MENLTFNIHDIMMFLALVAAIWGFYQMVVKIAEPRKALEQQVQVLEKWHKDDHKRMKVMEKRLTLVLKSLYYLVEHEITGNGIADFDTIKKEVEGVIFPNDNT